MTKPLIGARATALPKNQKLVQPNVFRTGGGLPEDFFSSIADTTLRFSGNILKLNLVSGRKVLDTG